MTDYEREYKREIHEFREELERLMRLKGITTE